MKEFESKPQTINNPEKTLDDTKTEILSERKFIVNLCRTFLSTRNGGRYVDRAEELGNQAIARACERVDQYKREKHLRAWLGRIATNEVNDFFRKIKNEPSESKISIDDTNDDGSKIFELQGAELSPEEHLIQKERLETLREGIATLSLRQRQALELSIEREDGKYEDIATQMETSVPAVKALVFQAKRKLKEHAESKERKKK
jgi:RNA polymerase sigma factor (sigma-70 family)